MGIHVTLGQLGNLVESDCCHMRANVELCRPPGACSELASSYCTNLDQDVVFADFLYRYLIHFDRHFVLHQSFASQFGLITNAGHPAPTYSHKLSSLHGLWDGNAMSVSSLPWQCFATMSLTLCMVTAWSISDSRDCRRHLVLLPARNFQAASCLYRT